jgi:hypothetical protein
MCWVGLARVAMDSRPEPTQFKELAQCFTLIDAMF